MQVYVNQGSGWALYYICRDYLGSITLQNPDFSHNFNRYSYAHNNPLIYTDPDGEFPWLIVVGTIIGAYIGGSSAEKDFNPANWNWNKNTWVGMGIGACVGALGGWGA